MLCYQPRPSPSTLTKGLFIAVTTLVCMCVADLVRDNGFTSVSSSFRIVGNVRESISFGHCWPVLLPDIVLVASGPVSGPVFCIPWDILSYGLCIAIANLASVSTWNNYGVMSMVTTTMHISPPALPPQTTTTPMDFPHPHNHQTHPPPFVFAHGFGTSAHASAFSDGPLTPTSPPLPYVPSPPTPCSVSSQSWPMFWHSLPLRRTLPPTHTSSRARRKTLAAVRMASRHATLSRSDSGSGSTRPASHGSYPI
ncbi:hypothetical protein EDB85DRAFT_2009473 [Lactarius pseudohatsudake]|nr:hypothetical protein EDB85DRAFT_2009473 [Lactarius pseudohatsudake]